MLLEGDVFFKYGFEISNILRRRGFFKFKLNCSICKFIPLMKQYTKIINQFTVSVPERVFMQFDSVSLQIESV